MRGLYFKILLPNVTTLPFYGNIYYTNDVSYDGSPVIIRAASGGAVTETIPFIRKGFQVDSFSLAMGMNSYEPGGCIIIFDNTDGNWQTVALGANLRGCTVYVYCLENNGEIYTDNRLGTFEIKNWSFPSPLKFQLDLTDDSPDRMGNGMPQISLDGDFSFPNSDVISIGQYINIGFGNFSALSIPASYDGVGDGWYTDGIVGGVSVDFLTTYSPANTNISINKVWIDGVLKDTPGLYDVINETVYFPSGQEGRKVVLNWNATTSAKTITFEADYNNYQSVRMIAMLLGIIGGFEAMDYTGGKNTAFQLEMQRRDIDVGGTSSNLKVSYQEKKNIADILNEFCESVGLARWRVNRKRQVELITLTPGNIVEDYTLGQPDIFEMKINSNYDLIENYWETFYSYLPHSGEYIYKNAFNSVNKKRSQEIYGKIQSTSESLYRWIYFQDLAYSVSVFTAIDKCLPRIEVSAVFNDDTCTPLLLPGDVIKAKHQDAIDKGAEYRYYWIESLRRDILDGAIMCDMIDITHIANMEYTRKLSLQPQWTGQTFYDTSIARYITGRKGIINNATDRMVISVDSGAISGYSWRTNDPAASNAYLYWVTSGTNFGNVLNFTNYCVSFRMKLTDTATGQVMCCCSRLSAADDYWRINYNKDIKRLGFVLYVGGVAQVTCVTANNSYTDTNWHHIVFQKRGTTFEIYIDGVLGGTATSSTTNAITGDMYIGALYTASGGISLPFLGYMEEFHVWHEANPWSANGSTCIAQTAPVTWFGINNAWPFYGTPA